MRNFTYHSQEEKENLEAILRRRKRKFNRQQITAGIITAILLGMLGLYFAFHMYYTEYDGYIHVDANKVRTPFDIYLDSVYVKEGAIVAPGDTLYSYFNINQLIEHFNINTEPAAVGHYRNMTLQIAELQRQISVLRAHIRELQAEIAIEDHNISFGLSSNAHKLDLERDLNIARVQLQGYLRQLGTVSGLRNQTRDDYSRASSVSGGGSNHAAMIFDDANSALLYETKSYHLASDSSIVTDILAPDRMVFFEKEEIMTTQHIDLEANNLMVVAYIPIDAMHRITRHSEAEIVVNSDFSFKAHVSVLGLRTEVIPDNLRSYFSKRNTAVIALLTIDEGQMVPFWTMANGIPVNVRVRNFDTWGEKPSGRNYLWYKTGDGLQTDLPDDWVYTRATAIDSTLMYPASPTTQPTTQAPTTQAPASQAPASQAPTSQAPASQAPTSQAPASQAPATQAPATQAPTSQAPTSQAPTSQAPTSPSNQRQFPGGCAAGASAGANAGVNANVAPDGAFYVIGAALNTEAGAKKTVDHYKSKYPQAGILHDGKKWLVYLSRHKTRPEAESVILEARKTPSLSGAWILQKDTQK